MYYPGCPTALVSDTHTAEVAYTPYARPSDAASLRTAIPRGLSSFVVRNAVLALKPVNDTELLSVSVTLPQGFGWVLNEVHLQIIQDQAGAFEDELALVIANSSRANVDFSYHIPIPFVNYSNNGTNLQARASRVPAGILPRTPIVPAGIATLVQLRASNLSATVASAGTVDALLSFWMFDLQQLQYFPAHVAEAVVTR